MKRILATHIDTGGHGYISVSKKDIKELGIQNEISGFSGLTLKRVYLEEDADGTLLHMVCKERGIPLYVKSSYNPQFKFHHNYSPDLLDWEPKIGNIVIINDKEFKVHHINDKIIVVTNENGGQYKVSKINPFKHITGIKQA